MPWFRLDDSFHSHPKVIAAGNEAVGLFVRSGTYAAEHTTDGFIAEEIAELYGASATGSRRNPGTGKPETLAETLVRTGLWHRARRGWTIHDYLDYNPSREAVEKERKAAAERQRRRRDGNSSRRDSPRDNDVSHTTPTRPDPYISGTGLSSADGRARARSPASENPSSRPVEEVMTLPPAYRPASPESVAVAAAAAREAIARKRTPP